MLSTKTERIAFIAVLVGIAAAVLVWRDDTSDDHMSPKSEANLNRHAGRDAVLAAPATLASSVTQASREMRAPIRLEVQAPPDVRVGDVFQARVEIEANTPVREVIFSIAYERSLLRVVGRSEGDFVRQRGDPSQLELDEPSDGNVQGVLRTATGAATTGSGSIAVFELEAIRPGTSAIELQNVMATDAAGETNTNASVAPKRVTIH